MTAPLHRFSAPLPKVDFAEVLRYAACRRPDGATEALCHLCALEGGAALRPQLVWRETDVAVEGRRVTLDFAAVESETLAQQLQGCRKAVVFAATLGLELDRLIARHGHLRPSRALLLDALGSERIEALCDAFCAHLSARYAPLVPRPRFSPGYGDLPLAFQHSLFAALDCSRSIGLFLNGSLLMSPVKSVTAIVGLGGDGACEAGCPSCPQQDCPFRRA